MFDHLFFFFILLYIYIFFLSSDFLCAIRLLLYDPHTVYTRSVYILCDGNEVWKRRTDEDEDGEEDAENLEKRQMKKCGAAHL